MRKRNLKLERLLLTGAAFITALIGLASTWHNGEGSNVAGISPATTTRYPGR